MAESIGKTLLDQLLANLDIEISSGLQAALATRLDQMYEADFFGNTQIAAVLRGVSGMRDRLNDSGYEDIVSVGEQVGQAKEDTVIEQPAYDIVTMDDLENYTIDNPFDASEGSFRFEFDASIDIQTAITNFSDDDILFFENSPTGEESDFNVIVDDYESNEAEVWVSNNEIHLMGLESNYFWNAESFKSIFGEDSLVFA